MRTLVIGGFPRAGTRQFADIINYHNDIEVKGEVFPKTLASIEKLLDFGAERHDKHWSSRSFNGWKEISALNMYAALSKGTNSPFQLEKKSILGVKCPRIEIDHLILKKLGILKRESVFFYCVRDFKQNFLSENSMFNVNVNGYIKNTINSLRCFYDIFNDDGISTSVLHLNEFLEKDRPVFVRDKIFKPLVGTVSLEFSESAISSTTNRNGTIEKGRKRRFDLNDDEITSLTSSKDLMFFSEKFKDDFGVDLMAGLL